MLSPMLLIGVLIFGASVFLILGLLAANGGANKSRQFAVLGYLLSGRRGPRIRRLQAMPGQLQGARFHHRRDRSFIIQPLSSLDAKGRAYKICCCTGSPATDEEIDLGKLPR